VSDINTAVVDSLKVLDPKRPIREADIDRPLYDLCLHPGEWMAEVSVDEMVDAIQPNKADHD
jgi:hypothetical protein